jgi:hypothetical protein
VIGNDTINWLSQVFVCVKTRIKEGNGDAATLKTVVGIHPQRDGQRPLIRG